MPSASTPPPIATRPPPSGGMEASEQALWTAARGGDASAREALVKMHLPYARVVAATYYARRTHDEVQFDEYHQLASLGLMESIDRFEPERGFLFRTYAARRMQGAILNGLEISTERSQQVAARRRAIQDRLENAKKSAKDKSADGETRKTSGAITQTQERLLRYLAEVGAGLALGLLLEDTGMYEDENAEAPRVQASPEVSYFRKTDMQRLQQFMRGLLKRLPPQERTVLQGHYLQDQPFEQIAQSLGVSRGRISQIHRSALERLRDYLGDGRQWDITI